MAHFVRFYFSELDKTATVYSLLLVVTSFNYLPFKSGFIIKGKVLNL